MVALVVWFAGGAEEAKAFSTGRRASREPIRKHGACLALHSTAFSAIAIEPSHPSIPCLAYPAQAAYRIAHTRLSRRDGLLVVVVVVVHVR